MSGLESLRLENETFFCFLMFCVTCMILFSLYSVRNSAMQGHKMTVVETDGVHVVPFVTDNLYIYSGETYSVLVTTDQNHSRNYGISINVIA